MKYIIRVLHLVKKSYGFSIYLTFFSAIEVLEEAKRTPESMGWNNNLIH